MLRRLKSEVATQMPKKYEHVVLCRLSSRQRFLYEDFLSRSSTRAALGGGNFLSMMNVLMQLRKASGRGPGPAARARTRARRPPLRIHT